MADGSTDIELAAGAAQGDRQAFAMLLERHYDTIYRVALRYTGVPADAEDIAQEVCLKLVGALGSFRGQSRFATWLYRIALNACRDASRRRAAGRSLAESYVAFREMEAADEADSAARTGRLHEVVAGLEPSLKETVLLVLSEELSHRQAAEILGCAESTVSWRLHEARKRLKAQMVEEDG
jgi:RNA polymerase sigma-70 factor (ECF subfamily)